MLGRIATGLLILLSAAGCRTKPVPAAADPYPFVRYPLSKILPEEQPEMRLESTLRLAGREYETLVFGVANSTPRLVEVTGIEASFSGNPDLKARLYRQEYVEITKPAMFLSRASGKKKWPDPLLPVSLEQRTLDGTWIDVFSRPIVVPPGQNRVFIFEIYLSAGGARSKAQGELRMMAVGRQLPPVTISVSPYGFDLPAASSLRTAVGFQFGAVAQKHAQTSKVPFEAKDLHSKYLRLLAQFRLSPYSPQYEPLKAQKTREGLLIDWGEFDRYVGNYLDGTLDPELLPGTSIRFAPAQKGLSDQDLPDYYRAVAGHFQQKGWLKKAFYYLPDEPLRRQFPAVRREARTIKSIVPELKTLVTKQFSPKLKGAVDIWCPDIPFIGDSISFLPITGRGTRLYWSCQLNFEPSIYRKRRSLGEEAWFYACVSARFGPYPNLFIDSEAACQRVIPWLAARYGFQGFLYWETTYLYRGDWNPWLNSRTPYPNGEGNLLYPGTPEMTGLPEHVPVPSLRLLLLREGFEDFEYLLLRFGDNEIMQSNSRKILLSSISWQRKIEKIQDYRDAIGAELERSVP
jgi:hypothetical protein